jgi:hypothetical protein
MARSVEKQRRGGGWLEEEERPDKWARPVSRGERGKGKSGLAAVFGPEERRWAGGKDWAERGVGPRGEKEGKGKVRGLGGFFKIFS